jgi:circadian clock protein KaiC
MCEVTKMRGSGFAEGGHYYDLDDTGMTVYPRLIPEDHGQQFVQEAIESGVPELDAMTAGGIERGTVTVISGPSGVGKTSLGAHYMSKAALRGERSAIYSFDEGFTTFTRRLEKIGVPIQRLLDDGNLTFDYIEPLRYNPDRLALRVREAVETGGVRVVMLDSLSGYRQSVRGEDMVERVHALCRYLVNMGVTVILVNEAQSVAGGELRATQDGISYLADTILLLRYTERDAELRKSIGVLKKRTSDFDKTLREFAVTEDGVTIGDRVQLLQGVSQGGARGGDSNGDA